MSSLMGHLYIWKSATDANRFTQEEANEQLQTIWRHLGELPPDQFERQLESRFKSIDQALENQRDWQLKHIENLHRGN